MHGAGVVHGDLKPGNVRVYDDGHVCILDVESAIVGWQSSAASDRARVTHTRGYAAPEVEEGVDCTPASDVYSLGVMLRTKVGNAESCSGADGGAPVLMYGVAACSLHMSEGRASVVRVSPL